MAVNFPPISADQLKPVAGVQLGYAQAGIRKTGSAEVEAMFFRCEEDLPERIRMVYRMVANEWRGQYELQLHSEYWEAV